MSGYQNPFVAPYGMMPYQAPYQSPAIQAPQSQVVRVNGENGARAYQIGANSSALLLDESGAMVWLVTTDGAGYKTVAPYDIVPHQSAPAPDFSALETRVQRLEEMINGNSRNTGPARKKQPDDGNYTEYDGHGQRRAKPAGYDPAAGDE